MKTPHQWTHDVTDDHHYCTVCGAKLVSNEYDTCKFQPKAPPLGPVRKMPQAELLGELRPGATYALRCTEYVAPHVFEQFAVALHRSYEDSVIKFVLLPHNLEFVEPPVKALETDKLHKTVDEILYDCCHSLSQPSMQDCTWGARLDYLKKYVWAEVERCCGKVHPTNVNGEDIADHAPCK